MRGWKVNEGAGKENEGETRGGKENEGGREETKENEGVWRERIGWGKEWGDGDSREEGEREETEQPSVSLINQPLLALKPLRSFDQTSFPSELEARSHPWRLTKGSSTLRPT